METKVEVTYDIYLEDDETAEDVIDFMFESLLPEQFMHGLIVTVRAGDKERTGQVE